MSEEAMERFTDNRGRKNATASSVLAYKRLAEYENTGLLPQQIEDLKRTLKKGGTHGKDNN